MITSREYEKALAPARQRFADDPAVRALFLGETDGPVL
jgi:hypothetical protein